MPGSNVNVPTADGLCAAYVTHPDGSGPFPAVLLFMDAIGLRPALRAMADRLAGLGYYVLVPNMFYRQGEYAPFDPTQIFGVSPAAPTPEFERLMKMVTALDDAGAMRDAAAFFDFLARDPKARGPMFGTLGYCMGGGFALAAACAHPARVAAAASFHGGRFVTDGGSPDVIATQLRAAAYLGVAEVDRRHTADTTRQLEDAFTRAGVQHAIELYPGTSHGFALSDLPVFHEAAAERHWAKLAEFFEQHLRARRTTPPPRGQT